jgi:hypothetical protein
MIWAATHPFTTHPIQLIFWRRAPPWVSQRQKLQVQNTAQMPNQTHQSRNQGNQNTSPATILPASLQKTKTTKTPAQNPSNCPPERLRSEPTTPKQTNITKTPPSLPVSNHTEAQPSITRRNLNGTPRRTDRTGAAQR